MALELEDIQYPSPIEEIFLREQFANDTNPNKINLTDGAYRTDDGTAWVLPVVRTVESQLASDDTLDKEYLPAEGLADFASSAVSLCFGDGHPCVLSQRALGVQTVGGSGALWLGLNFLRSGLNRSCLMLSSPASATHLTAAKEAGFDKVVEYRYWRSDTRELDEQGLLEDLSSAEAGSVLLMHGVGHRPTGCDPSQSLWQQILETVRDRRLFLVLDMSYQGLATGDLEADGYAAKVFADSGIGFFVVQSFSKNFGLYNERVGCLTIVSSSPESSSRARSHLISSAHSRWLSPPNHGARVVATILKNPALAAEWRENLRRMTERIRHMRFLLHQRLRVLGTPGTWHHVVSQTGIYCYTGLSCRQMDFLRSVYSVYGGRDGRINASAVTSKTVDRIALAIHESVVKEAGVNGQE